MLATPHVPASATPLASAPLDAARLRNTLAAHGVGGSIEVVATIDSTSSELLRRLRSDPACALPMLLAAECQSDGRGRQGRRWIAPAGSAITASFARRLALPPAALGGLSLVCGLAVQETLARHGIVATLKWPNDVLVAGRKLAGILVEVHAAQAGATDVVIGIGLNVALPADLPAGLPPGALAPIDMAGAQRLAAVRRPLPIDRTTVLADLACALHQGLERFTQLGFAPFVDAWNAVHAWRDQPVELSDGDTLRWRGIARGIDDGGRLCIDTPDGPRTVVSGEVSLRRAT